MNQNSKGFSALNIIILVWVYLTFAELSALVGESNIAECFQLALNLGVFPALMILCCIALFKMIGSDYRLGAEMPLRAKEVFWCLGAGVVISGMILSPLALLSLWILDLLQLGYKMPAANEMVLEMSGGALVILSGYMIIIAPITEEIFFRRYLFDNFRAVGGKYFAAILVSASFAAVHSTLLQFAGLFVFALILQAVRSRFGLRWAMLVHGASNMTALAGLLLSS